PRDAQPDEAFFVLEPEALRMQIRQETATRLVVGVGYRVPHHWSLAGDLANPGHRSFLVRERAGTIPVDPRGGQGTRRQIRPRSASETWPPRLTTRWSRRRISTRAKALASLTVMLRSASLGSATPDG